MTLDEIRKSHKEHLLREGSLSDEYITFAEENKEAFDTLYSYYRCAVMEVETKFRVLDEQFSMQYDRDPIESIKTRLKSTDSLLKKMRMRQIPLTLEAVEQYITDIAGVRVICGFNEDIYWLAECLLRQDDVVLLERRDYIQNPKSTGYRSLHLIVQVPVFLAEETRYIKVEVQLRTIAMDFWASLEHKLRYKKDVPDEIAVELSNELLDCANMTAALDSRMQELKHKIIPAAEERESEKRHRLPADFASVKLVAGSGATAAAPKPQ